MIAFDNYKKDYGSGPVLEIENLTLPKGIYWLQGENGTGKSTLLKSIAGLMPYKGTISVNNKSIQNSRPEYALEVNYSEAEPLFPGFLTGNNLLEFYSTAKLSPVGQLSTVSSQLNINHYTQNKIATYSSGMNKKLALCMAFLGSPSLIMLDEPLITLDTIAVATLVQMIEERHAAGCSFIITSHQPIPTTHFSTVPIRISNKTLVVA